MSSSTPKKIVDDIGNRVEWINEKGQLHREDGPAIEWSSGGKSWYIKGKCHREDGPAIEQISGYKAWYIYDKLHRVDGPAIIQKDGTKRWYINGLRHRVDGPAVKESGCSKQWWINGKCHREDGPAVELSDGSKRWFLKGIEITQSEFVKFQRERVTPIIKVVFTYHSPVSVVHSRGLLKDLLPLIVNETYT